MVEEIKKEEKEKRRKGKEKKVEKVEMEKKEEKKMVEKVEKEEQEKKEEKEKKIAMVEKVEMAINWLNNQNLTPTLLYSNASKQHIPWATMFGSFWAPPGGAGYAWPGSGYPGAAALLEVAG